VGTGTEGCTLLKFLATIPEGRCIATCDIYPPNLKKGVETIDTQKAFEEAYENAQAHLKASPLGHA
jgi:hypothetical protein